MIKKVSEIKKNEVQEIKRLAKENPVIGIVNLENLPAFQLLRIKSNLRDKIVLKVTKKRLVKIAFNELKDEVKGIIDLNEKLGGIPALVFTKEDPFLLAKIINKNKSKCAAKPGQKAPNDINIPAGPTDFPAGPIIGELGQMGIKSQVVDGKIHIREDKIVVKEGEIINAKVADLLSKMKIEPMEVGLNLTLTLKNGEILTKDVLFVDEKEYLDNIRIAHNNSIALAMKIGYVCKEIIERMISKAEIEAKALEKKVGKLKIEEKVVKAVGEEIKEEPMREEIKEEPMREEIKEETFKEIRMDDDGIKAEDAKPIEQIDDTLKKVQEILQKAVDEKIASENLKKQKIPTAEELQKKILKESRGRL